MNLLKFLSKRNLFALLIILVSVASVQVVASVSPEQSATANVLTTTTRTTTKVTTSTTSTTVTVLALTVPTGANCFASSCSPFPFSLTSTYGVVRIVTSKSVSGPTFSVQVDGTSGPIYVQELLIDNNNGVSAGSVLVTINGLANPNGYDLNCQFCEVVRVVAASAPNGLIVVTGPMGGASVAVASGTTPDGLFAFPALNAGTWSGTETIVATVVAPLGSMVSIS